MPSDDKPAVTHRRTLNGPVVDEMASDLRRAIDLGLDLINKPLEQVVRERAKKRGK